MVAIYHSKTSLIPDDVNTDLVRPSDWNASHVIAPLSAVSSLLGTSSSSTAITEITLGTNLSMSGTTLNGPSLTGYVPYSGATSNVNLGAYSLTAASISGATAWNAATITAPYGGTGFASYAVGDILYANTTTSLAKLADVATGNALISGGVGVAPSWGKISLTTAISGILPIANGGTNASSQTTNGVCFFNGTSITSDAYLSYTPSNSRFFMQRASEPGSLYFIDLGSGYTQFITSYGSLCTKTTFCNNVSIQEDFQLASSSVGASIILAATLMTIGTTSATDLRFIRGSTERLRLNASGALIPSAQNLTVGLAASGTKKFTVSDTTAALTDIIQLQGNYSADGYGSAITFTDATPTTLARINSLRESNNNIALSASVFSSGTLRTAWLASSDGSFRTFGTAGTASFFANSGEHLFYTAGTPYMRFVQAFNDAYVQTYTSNSSLYLTGAAGAQMSICKVDAAITFTTGVFGAGTSVVTNLLTIGNQNAANGEAVRLNGNNTQNYMSWYNNTTREGYIGTGAGGLGLVLNGDANGLILQSGSGTTLCTGTFVAYGSVTTGYRAGVTGGLYLSLPSVYGKPAVQAVTSAFAADVLSLNPAGGKVGVATTNPLTAFQVGSVSDTTANALRIANANSTNANPLVSFFASGAQENTIALANGSLLFSVNPASYTTANLVSSAKLTLTSGGNFGVGVNPVARLHVSASVGAPSSYVNYGLLMYDGGTASGSYGLGIDGSTLWYNSASFHVWYTNAVEVMKIYFGNLGVNCTNPLGRVAICGGSANAHTIELGYSGGLTANYFESINRASGASVDFVYYMGGATLHRFYTSNLQRCYVGAGFVVGAPTGGDAGAGFINVAGGIRLNNTAYTNPDFVYEHFFTGKIIKYANNGGAAEYKGLMPIDDLRKYVKKHHRFPVIKDEPTCIFVRADIALQLQEEAHLYIFQLHDRTKSLEFRVDNLEASNENKEIAKLKDRIKTLEKKLAA